VASSCEWISRPLQTLVLDVFNVFILLLSLFGGGGFTPVGPRAAAAAPVK
jgi:hypothetical protein